MGHFFKKKKKMTDLHGWIDQLIVGQYKVIKQWKHVLIFKDV